MTVKEAIAELEKVDDKSVQVFTDCPKCGQANAIRKLDLVLVLRTKAQPD